MIPTRAYKRKHIVMCLHTTLIRTVIQILLISTVLITGTSFSSTIENFDTDNSLDTKATSEDMFAPDIRVILTEGTPNATINPFGGTGCEFALYQITVRNYSTSGESLNNIVFQEIFENDPEFTAIFSGSNLNDDGILEPGESWTFRGIRPLTQTHFDDGKISSQVRVTANVVGQSGATVEDLSHPTDFNMDETTSIAVNCVEGISVIKTGQTKDGGGADGGCAAIEYTYTVTNTGDPTYTFFAVSVFDPNIGVGGISLSAPVSGDDGDFDLEPGETWVFTATYVITQDDIDNGFVSGQAVVFGELKDDPEANFSSDLSDYDDFLLDRPTVTDITDCQPSIVILKQGGLDPIGSCQFINYTFRVANTSGNGQVLENVSVTDLDIPGLIINGPLNGDNNSDSKLDPDEIWDYAATYTITTEDFNLGMVLNRAEVTATVENQLPLLEVSDISHPISISEDDFTEVDISSCVDPNIALIKTGDTEDLSGNDGCDESIVYKFRVVNTGNVDLEDVILMDGILSDDPIPGPLPGEDDNNDGILSVGEEWAYEFIYPITQADIIEGDVTNIASVTANQINTNISVTDSSDPIDLASDGDTITITDDTCPAGPAISLLKDSNLVDLNNDDCYETVQYIFTVTNTGSSNLTDISLLDTTLFGDTPIDGLLPNQDDNDDGVLSVGEDWVFEALYPITQADIDAGQIENQAEVFATGEGIDVSDESHPTSQTLNGLTITPTTADVCVAGPAIGLVKVGILLDLVDDDGCSDTIRYVFTVTNTGTTNLSQISIEDNELGNIPINGPLDDDDDDILSVNETWTYEAFYPISDIDIAQGNVTNQAEVFAVEEGTGVQISDLSHDESLALNGDTVTSTVDACDFGPGLGLIKAGQMVDVDDDGCPDAIQYTFIVRNIGTSDLNTIVLTDEPLFGTEPLEGPILGTDEDNDEILSVGEYWAYVALYPFTQEDINLGEIENQASVTAMQEGTNNSVSDVSDYENNFQNRPTITIVQDDCLIELDEDFEIYTGMTPNGDGINDYFSIRGIENYPENNLKIFNRWGVQVYEANRYGIDDNIFVGVSLGRATISAGRELPSGTYFYILTFTDANPGEESYSGYLYINRD
ncbi:MULTISPECIES: gliding motility-associated C-terminal domain-containing protein [Flavobacteriaceae]|uniref:gliding motility-associated C-terminal domain-containing protein n=1 Tax=Flavobacteriaceae TaxID=49546 RepID=UPI0014917C6D|nr:MULTISPECIES: gliding motility-associated C-terminal domain-containing protein [Allomuricauda]MDC6364541.1 gliding motility-associated C-terminal domain-containing protein [Muricauda sp. AC10]